MRLGRLAWVLGVGLSLLGVTLPAGATLIELTLTGQVSSAPGGGANPGDPVELEIRISDDFINQAASQGGRYFDAQARLALTVGGETTTIDGVWVGAETIFVDPEDPDTPSLPGGERTILSLLDFEALAGSDRIRFQGRLLFLNESFPDDGILTAAQFRGALEDAGVDLFEDDVPVLSARLVPQPSTGVLLAWGLTLLALSRGSRRRR